MHLTNCFLIESALWAEYQTPGRCNFLLYYLLLSFIKLFLIYQKTASFFTEWEIPGRPSHLSTSHNPPRRQRGTGTAHARDGNCARVALAPNARHREGEPRPLRLHTTPRPSPAPAVCTRPLGRAPPPAFAHGPSAGPAEGERGKRRFEGRGGRFRRLVSRSPEVLPRLFLNSPASHLALTAEVLLPAASRCSAVLCVRTSILSLPGGSRGCFVG